MNGYTKINEMEAKRRAIKSIHQVVNEPFNTNALFLLSGDQPYRRKEMAIPEKKEKIFDVKKADVDLLHEKRKSHESA
jgi:hypothetical protein